MGNDRCNHLVAQVVEVQIIRGDLPVADPPGGDQRIDGALHADAGKVIVPADFQMDVLGADHVVIADIVNQHHRHAVLKNPTHQALIGLLEEGRVVVIDAELHENHVRPVPQQILLHPGNAELGGGAADAGVDEVRVGKMTLPPFKNPGGIAVFLLGSQGALGDGTAQESDGDPLPFCGPLHHPLHGLPIAPVDHAFFKIDHIASSQISSPRASRKALSSRDIFSASEPRMCPGVPQPLLE